MLDAFYKDKALIGASPKIVIMYNDVDIEAL